MMLLPMTVVLWGMTSCAEEFTVGDTGGFIGADQVEQSALDQNGDESGDAVGELGNDDDDPSPFLESESEEKDGENQEKELQSSRNGLKRYAASFAVVGSRTRTAGRSLRMLWLVDASDSIISDVADMTALTAGLSSVRQIVGDVGLTFVAGKPASGLDAYAFLANYGRRNASKIRSSNALEVARALLDQKHYDAASADLKEDLALPLLSGVFDKKAINVIVVVSDSSSSMSAQEFQQFLTSKYPGYQIRFFGFIAAAQDGGRRYASLAKALGGEVYDVLAQAGQTQTVTMLWRQAFKDIEKVLADVFKEKVQKRFVLGQKKVEKVQSVLHKGAKLAPSAYRVVGNVVHIEVPIAIGDPIVITYDSPQ